MSHPDNPFGPFKNDKQRLEAVRLYERRRLLLGLSMYATATVIGLLTDHPATVATSLGALFKAFSQ